MSLSSEHRALVFVAAVAVLGAGVRVLRAAGRSAAPPVQSALEHQMQAADSSARAERGGGRGRRTPAKSSRSGKKDGAHAPPAQPIGAGPLDRPGYIAGKLDLDVATAAQIDSLPGVSPAMAKRIVADRRMRGPFLGRDGLRRVSGAGPKFIGGIDTLVVFSGTFVQPNAADTTIPRLTRPRAKPRVRPPI
jgi:competence protein ComEA